MKYNIFSHKPSIVWVSQKIIDNKLSAKKMNAKYIKELDQKFIQLNIDIKRNEELIELLTDYTANGSFKWLRNNREYTDETGVPFIRIKNLTTYGMLDFSDLKYITKETYEKFDKTKLKGGELLFSKTGSVGRTIVFPENISPASLADNVFKVIYKQNVNVYYIDSFFRSKYGKLWVERLSQGGVQPTIIKKSFRNINIPIPSIEVQNYIGNKVKEAKILRNNSKKIRNDTEDNLENILNIKEFNFSSDKYLLTNSISERRIDPWYYKPIFERVLNHLESKFKTKKLKDFSKIGKGFSYSSNQELGDIPYLRISDIDNYHFKMDDVLKVPEDVFKKRKNKQLQNFDLVFAITGATIGKIASVINEDDKKITLSADTGFIRIEKQKHIYPLYLLTFLKTRFGQLQIKQSITGATNHHLSLDDVGSIKIPIIDQDQQEKIHNKILKSIKNEKKAKFLIKEAKKDIEDLIEGKLEVKNSFL